MSRPTFSLARATSPFYPPPRLFLCHRVQLTNALRPAFQTSTRRHTRFSPTNTRCYAALAGRLPSQPITVLQTPSLDYIKQEELDVELLPPDEVKLVITDRAAEVRHASPQFVKLNTSLGHKQLRSIAVRGNNSSAALRISVESGGCHGYQYKMELAQGTQPDD